MAALTVPTGPSPAARPTGPAPRRGWDGAVLCAAERDDRELLGQPILEHDLRHRRPLTRDRSRVSTSLDGSSAPPPRRATAGTFWAHPAYDSAHEFKNDVAVVQLDQAVPGTSTLATLPPAGMLDRMKADGSLSRSRFTSVGYGFRG